MIKIFHFFRITSKQNLRIAWRKNVQIAITNGNVCHDSGALFALISLRNFARFGSVFFHPIWVELCHFWGHFCVIFLDESVPLLGVILCHLF